MNSIRPVALSLCLAAACGGALLFSLSSAKGQPSNSASGSSSSMSNGASGSSSSMANSASGSSSSSSSGGAGAPAASTSVGSPPLKQVIGISPVQTGKKNIFVFGGTGNESYDLQYENVYSLLRQRGVQIPNVLHPLSTAKPSFILERLIVLSLTGANSNTASSAPSGASGGSSSSGSDSSRGATPSASGAAAQKPAGPSDAERTVAAVRAVVDAEISRGSGRAGGAHKQKLQLLSRAIAALEAANNLGAAISQAVGGASGGSSGSGAAATGGDKSKLDPREILYGQARITSRAADRYAPTGL